MTLRIRLLGDIAIEDDGRQVTIPVSSKATAVLVWLALNPGEHSRGRIAPIFWPDVLDESARASLRTAIWTLRRALGDASAALVSGRETLGFAEGATDVDTLELARLIASGRLLEAAEIAHADLAPGVDEEWLEERREAHRAVLDDLYEHLAAAAEGDGDLGAAVIWSRRRVWLDPLAEDSQRTLLRRLAAVGDRAGVLHSFERFRTRLRVELGLVPSAETAAIVESVRADRLGSPELPARLAAVATEAHVGRDRELDQLLGHWQRASGSRLPTVVAVSGEPGVGKTRLVAELALRVQAAGHRAVYGAASPEALVPYQPFVEALAEGLGRPFEELEAETGSEPTGARRYRLFDEVATLAGSLAEPAAALFALDDLQWADVSTAQLIRHIARSHKARGVLLVLAYRPGEIGGALADLLMELNRESPLERVVLGDLGEEDVAELLRVWGADVTVGGAQSIHDRTRGNPFFVRELLRHLAESEDALGSVPPTVREIVRARIARLDAGARALIAAGAVAGPAFDAEVANAVLDEPLVGRAVARAVDTLVGAGLLNEPDRAGSLRFEHTLVRDAIYENLTVTRRTAFHVALAEHVIRRHGSASGPHLAEIAHHYRAAGFVHGLEWTIAAADYAFEHVAFDQAAGLYGQAIAALPTGDDRRTALVRRRAMASQLSYHAIVDAPRRRE